MIKKKLVKNWKSNALKIQQLKNILLRGILNLPIICFITFLPVDGSA